MLRADVKVGGLYRAKVSGVMVTVRLDTIRRTSGSKTMRSMERFEVTNLRTGKKVTFKSAAKFHGPVTKYDQQQDTTTKQVDDAERKRFEAGLPNGLSIGPNGGLTHETGTGADSCIAHQAHIVDAAEQMLVEAGLICPNCHSGPCKCEDALPSDAEAAQLAQEHREDEQLGRTGEPLTEVGREQAKLSLLASKLGNVKVGPAELPVGETMLSLTGDGRTLTEEQDGALKLAMQLIGSPRKGRVLVLKAGAGSGKTYQCQQLELALPGRGKYTAFNKSLVEDGRSKFKRADVSTTYSMAYREVGHKFAHRLPGKVQRVRSDEIARRLGIEGMRVELVDQVDEHGEPLTKWLSPGFLAGQCIVAVKKFMQSADDEVGLDHFGYIDGIDSPTVREDGSKKRGYDNNNNRIRKVLLDAARRMWADVGDPKGALPLPGLTHGAYFKAWQLSKPKLAVDYVMLDEYQDTAPVLIDVLKQQTHALVILVGDDNQRIYDFLGAVNAGDHFPDAPTAMLSQSFRFGQTVADVANAALAQLEEPTDLVMSGFDKIPSRVCRVDEPKCFLYRTNAGAVGRLMRGIEDGKSGHLVGGGADVVAFCKAAIQLQANPPKPTDHPKLCCFTSWKEVEEYSATDEGEDLKLMVKLIKAFTAEKIRDALEHMPSEQDADFVACTAHKSKGREWSSVKLGQDFPTAKRTDDSGWCLLYVAATRAREELDITECPPFSGGVELIRGEDGEVESEEQVPGIRVTYTVPMPTAEQLATYRAEKGQAKEGLSQEAFTSSIRRAYGESGRLISFAEFVKERLTRQDNGNHLQQNAGEDFTWAKPDGEWLVRGPANMTGKMVTVTRRNGTSSKERLVKVVKKLGDLWFYSNR